MFSVPFLPDALPAASAKKFPVAVLVKGEFMHHHIVYVCSLACKGMQCSHMFVSAKHIALGSANPCFECIVDRVDPAFCGLRPLDGAWGKAVLKSLKPL